MTDCPARLSELGGNTPRCIAALGPGFGSGRPCKSLQVVSHCFFPLLCLGSFSGFMPPAKAMPDHACMLSMAACRVCLQSARSVGGPSCRPIVFALSNPTEQAEVSFQDALTFTGGAAVYAGGSPFAPVTTRLPGGRLRALRPAQANNCFVFPGLAQGILASGVRHVDDRLLLAAAEAIAGEGAGTLRAAEQHVCAVTVTCRDSRLSSSKSQNWTPEAVAAKALQGAGTARTAIMSLWTRHAFCAPSTQGVTPLATSIIGVCCAPPSLPHVQAC
jgi:hypothetical protein